MAIGSGINFRKFHLAVGIGVWISLIFCAFLGCGSENNSPLSKKNEKASESEKSRIVEIQPQKGLPQKAEIKGQITSLQLPEVIPPAKPGGRGVTLEEVNAMEAANREVDPSTAEVIPPAKPGGRGVTLEEVNAMEAANREVDPSTAEVIPPAKPGGRGVTLGELNATRAAREERR
jgi:hypothetical protein